MNNLSQLLSVLERQLKACEEQIKTEKEKTKVLMQGDIEKLDEIVITEQSFIMKMGSLENKREAILAENSLNNITVSEIIAKYVSEPHKAGFINISQRLTKRIEELERVHSLNRTLLMQRMSVTEQVIKKISEGQKIPAGEAFLSKGKETRA